MATWSHQKLEDPGRICPGASAVRVALHHLGFVSLAPRAGRGCISVVLSLPPNPVMICGPRTPSQSVVMMAQVCFAIEHLSVRTLWSHQAHQAGEVEALLVHLYPPHSFSPGTAIHWANTESAVLCTWSSGTTWSTMPTWSASAGENSNPSCRARSAARCPMVFTRVSLNLEQTPIHRGLELPGGGGLRPRPSGMWMQPPALPEGGDDAQQNLVQPSAVLGVVSQDPVVAGEGYQAASCWADSLQGKRDPWALGAAVAGPHRILDNQGPGDRSARGHELRLPPAPCRHRFAIAEGHALAGPQLLARKSLSPPVRGGKLTFLSAFV